MIVVVVIWIVGMPVVYPDTARPGSGFRTRRWRRRQRCLEGDALSAKTKTIWLALTRSLGSDTPGQP